MKNGGFFYQRRKLGADYYVMKLGEGFGKVFNLCQNYVFK